MQNMNGLEKSVKDLIECLYNCEFVGKLTVSVSNGLYQLKLYFAELNIPAYVLACQCCSDEEFLDFVKRELETSNIIRTTQHKLILYGNYESTEGL